MMDKADVPPGTVDMLILRTLQLEPMHGLGISRRIEQITGGTFQLNPGTFFPALYRLEQEGLVKGDWGRSETNRRAKFYRLTRTGRRQLEAHLKNWEKVRSAIDSIIEAPQEG
jgi:PadR family transcriptional regulator, regulatory protein PadR